MGYCPCSCHNSYVPGMPRGRDCPSCGDAFHRGSRYYDGGSGRRGGGDYGYNPNQSYSYDQSVMDELQANIKKEQARAGTFNRSKDGRSWHEYHGVGKIGPDGNIIFDDNTPSGRHSHRVHNVDPKTGNAKPGWERKEGK